jgi:hypothetical protein
MILAAERGLNLKTEIGIVGLGIIVSLEELRSVLKELNVDGMRWWIASDPGDSLESGTITVGHFDPRCWDRLNRLYFRIPTLNEVRQDQTEGLMLLFDPLSIAADEPGYYFRNGHTSEDSTKDFISFFNPLNDALVTRLLTRTKFQSQDGQLAPFL